MNFPIAIIRPLRDKTIASINNEIDDELEFHIQCRIDELVAEGISPDRAESQSRADFGSTDRIRKQCQRINYGAQNRVIVLSFTVLAAAMVAICWLSFQLIVLKNQNANLSKELVSTTAPSVPNLLAIPGIKVQDRNDLFGTVMDSSEKPVADAKVLLIFKSWPKGKYRQEAMSTKTDAAGNYRFENLYSTHMQTAFLVSVVSDGYTLTSKYWINEERKVIESINLQLHEAIPKTFKLLQEDGNPMANTKVFPQSRNVKFDGSGGDSIYQQSADQVMLSTDDTGEVAMNYFAARDNASIGIVVDGRIVNAEFKVDNNPIQTIGGEPIAAASMDDKADVTGTVTGKDGSAIAGAMVLLIHKSWPNGRYQQKSYKTKTDKAGGFVFPKRYRLAEQNGFLVSIVADGWAMSSKYVFDIDGNKLDPFNFKLEKATAKTFVFQDENGNAYKQVAVYPASRKNKNDEAFMIYSDSGKDVDFLTDSDGKVNLNCFVVGDTATFGFEKGGSLEVEINDDAEQIVTVKKKAD